MTTPQSISRVIASVLLFANGAIAQDQIDPTTITATAGSMHSAPFPGSNLVDDLTLEGFTNVGNDDRPPNHQNNHWLAAETILTETVTFDLGGTYDLVRLDVLNTSNTNWNDSETDTFTVATSTDGGATYSAPSAPVPLQDYTLGFQEVPVVAAGATHVQIIATNDPALGVTTGTADIRVGLNEVHFFHQQGNDTDNDGMADDWEMLHFGDLSRDGTEDEDAPAPDGLNNKSEHDRGTDPKDADSDDDGLNDGDEVNTHSTDPLEADSDMDTISDGDEINIHESDPLSLDSDGDGLSDEDEVNTHMTEPGDADTDGDGIDDFEEINVTLTDPLVPNEDPRGSEIDPAEITATAGSTFDDTGRFDVSNLLDGLFDEGNRDNHQGTHWIAAELTLTETVTFDLGGSYSLTNLEILNTSNTNWNDSETDRFTVATSTDGGATFSAPSAEIELQDFTEGFQSVPVQASGATHVQLVVTNDGTVDGDPAPTTEARVGLNEVRFFTGPGTAFEITSVRRFEEEVDGIMQPAVEIIFNSNPGVNYGVFFSFNLVDWFEANDSVPSGGAETIFVDRDQGVVTRPDVYYRAIIPE